MLGRASREPQKPSILNPELQARDASVVSVGVLSVARDAEGHIMALVTQSEKVSDVNENGPVNRFPALIKFSWGLINLHPITMNE